MHFRGNVRWIISVGVTCVFLLVLLPFLPRQEAGPFPIVSASPIANDSPNNEKDVRVTQNPAASSNELPPKEDQPSESSTPVHPLSLPNERALEIHQKMVAELNAKMREATKGLYAEAFQELHLTADIQEKVIDILTQGQKQLEQQAFEAAQSGTLPALPSPSAVRAQQAEQNQQLRSLLGDASFAQFDQYRSTIPDRSTIAVMNQQGANLTESQTQQLLGILSDARRQIISQATITQNLDSMASDQAVAAMEQQQSLLRQTVNDRVQNILTPSQATLLQEILAQPMINPKVR
jgi:hypothetical protein